MSIAAHNLPEGLLDWACSAVNGELIHLSRHVARREAWIIDIRLADGNVLEGFLRLQRDNTGDPRRLEREVRIMQAIATHGIPSPEVYAWSDTYRAALLQRDPGRADIDKLTDPGQQRAIMEDFIHICARFHCLDRSELALDDIMLYYPETPRECALREVDDLVAQWQFFLKDYHDPLLAYAVQWLERFAPEQVARVSLLQGDTGPVNFMFQGDRVSSVIDWECGHYGDPLEDLGNIMVREFYNPCGGLEGLFKLYEQESGIPYNRFRAQYYAVQQNVRGMIPIHYVSLNGSEQESLRWYLCYKHIGDRATTEMLAMAMNIDLCKPALPTDSDSEDIVARSAIQIQQQDVLSSLDDQFARSRAEDVIALIECKERTLRFGPELDAAELDDQTELLGQRPSDVQEGRKDLVAAIKAGSVSDEMLLPALLRKVYRDEWLYQPAVKLYPQRTWSPID